MSHMLTADEIFGRPSTPVPWPSSRPVLDIAIEMLPTLEDDRTAELVEYLALALVDREDERRAVRAVLSEVLAQLRGQVAALAASARQREALVEEIRRYTRYHGAPNSTASTSSRTKTAPMETPTPRRSASPTARTTTTPTTTPTTSASSSTRTSGPSWT